MVIKSLTIRHEKSLKERTFEFANGVEFLQSTQNSVGKTTFIRAILYCLGFSVPSTKKVDFAQYYFQCCLEKDDKTLAFIERRRDTIVINGTEFNQKTDFFGFVHLIFGIDNPELISNLLGTIYIDQDKGWTLLNRGKIIGINSFQIESFLRGLNDSNVSELASRLLRVEDDYRRYKLMFSVADYQKELNDRGEDFTETTFDDALEAELGLLESKITGLEKSIKELSTVIKQNTDFVNYLSRLRLQVRIEGNDYTITHENLVGFQDVQSINRIRLDQLRNEKNRLMEKRARLLERDSFDTLVNVPSLIEDFDKSILRKRIDPLQVKSALDSLQKERESIREQISSATLEENAWVSRLAEYIKGYWDEMGIKLDFKDSFVLTRDLKSLSGAILYQIIVAFRLGYMRALFEKTKCRFPILIDSPAGREVKDEIVRKALSLVHRDFADHQIFVSSIFDYRKEFGGSASHVLSFDNLRAFDPVTFLDGN